MQCKYCGSPLSIEDAFCPFCGRENEAVKKHTEEMQRFSREFNQTKTAVVDETKRIKSYVPLIVLIVILSVANIAAIFVKENAYRFQDDLERKEAQKKAGEYRDLLLEYESSGNYTELASLYNSSGLYWVSDLREFSQVANAGSEYSTFVCSLENILGRRSRDYLIDDSEANDWKKIGESLRSFWSIRYSTSPSYLDFGTDKASHHAALEDMDNRISGLLISLCGFSEEELTELQKTDAQKLSTEIRSRLEDR